MDADKRNGNEGGETKTLFPGPQRNDSESALQFLMACSGRGRQSAQISRVQGRGGKIISLLPFEVLLARLIIQLAQGRVKGEEKNKFNTDVHTGLL